MFFKLPFSYTADVLKPRHRNSENVVFWEWLGVEIADVDEYEAPVAVEWNAEPPSWMGFADRDRWGRVPVDGLMQTRWKDGSHWWPVLGEEHDRDRRRCKVTAAALEAASAAGNDYYNPVMLNFNRHLIDGGAKPLEPSDYRMVENSTREREIVAIHAKASRLFVCDGLVWRRGGEPLLQSLPPRFEGEVLFFVARVVEEGSSEVKDRSSIMRSDRGEEIFTFFGSDKDFGRRVGTNVENLPRVFLPSALHYRDDERALSEAAGKLLEWRGKSPHLSDVSRPAAMAWYDLKEALEAMGEVASVDRVDRLAETILCYGNAIGGEEAQFAARATNRWNMRPIDAGDPKGPRS